MQPPPLPSAVASNTPAPVATVLATCAAVGAVLSVPIALIPVLGLAASMLIFGFIAALAVWTHRKRAFLGAGIALLSFVIASISTFLCFQGLVESRNEATARVAQVQSQLEAMKSRATSSSERSSIAEAIKILGGKDITDEQAKVWGGLAEWAVRTLSTDNSANSDPAKK